MGNSENWLFLAIQEQQILFPLFDEQACTRFQFFSYLCWQQQHHGENTRSLQNIGPYMAERLIESMVSTILESKCPGSIYFRFQSKTMSIILCKDLVHSIIITTQWFHLLDFYFGISVLALYLMQMANSSRNFHFVYLKSIVIFCLFNVSMTHLEIWIPAADLLKFILE